MSRRNYDEELRSLRDLQTIELTPEERALFGNGPAAIARLIGENRALRGTRERALIVPAYEGLEIHRAPTVGALHLAETYQLPVAEELKGSAFVFAFQEVDTGGRVKLCSIALVKTPATPAPPRPLLARFETESVAGSDRRDELTEPR